MNPTLLYQWTNELATHLPHLTSWQVTNLGLFSLGVIAAEGCQQGQIARKVAQGEAVESAARRWRRFLHGRQGSLRTFFAEWTAWVIGALGQARVTLVVDETKLGTHLGVMVVGVAWEGRCLPVAWRTYRANDAASYPREGQVRMIVDLLTQVQAGMPREQAVLVLADRGIGTSPELCQGVAQLGWHYLFRVTCQTKIVTQAGDLTIAHQVQPGEIWAAEGRVFKQRGKVPAHALALWSLGYEAPWALVTNDAQLTGYEYARRNWQEQSFRDLKSGGWHWGDSRVRHPDHCARLLMILVVAYGWVLALGSQRVHARCAHPLHRAGTVVRRHWSLFKDGLDYFTQYVQRFGVCLGLIFYPDLRLTVPLTP